MNKHNKSVIQTSSSLTKKETCGDVSRTEQWYRKKLCITYCSLNSMIMVIFIYCTITAFLHLRRSGLHLITSTFPQSNPSIFWCQKSSSISQCLLPITILHTSIISLSTNIFQKKRNCNIISNCSLARSKRSLLMNQVPQSWYDLI